jgi:DNA polymerase-3 subunit beta
VSEIKANQNIDLKIKKGNQLEFEIGNKLMTAREISGAFPNWEMVVPKTFEFFAETKATELKEALTRVGVMADDSHRRIEFAFFPNKLVLKSESAETGSSTEEINCTFQGLNKAEGAAVVPAEGWRIAFNTKYLMDFLALQNAKQNESCVIWKFGKHLAPGLLMFEGEERLFSYVIVPLK